MWDFAAPRRTYRLLELVKFFNEETKGVFGTVRTPLSDSRKGMINARIKSYGKRRLPT